MAAGESVSTSLIPAPGLEENAICAVSAVIDGETESIIPHRRKERMLAWLNICPHEGRRLDYAPGQFLRAVALLPDLSAGTSG